MPVKYAVQARHYKEGMTVSECEHKFGPPRWAGWGVCKKCGQDEYEWKRGEDKRTIAALREEVAELKSEIATVEPIMLTFKDEAADLRSRLAVAEGKVDTALAWANKLEGAEYIRKWRSELMEILK